MRGQRVILDADLAELHGVTTGRFNEQVRRNIERFPEDFMFPLTRVRFDSQIAISKEGRGGRRKLPLAFTEAGALSAARILKSRQAIQVGIYVHRAFVQLRDLVATHKNIAKQLSEIETRISG